MSAPLPTTHLTGQLFDGRYRIEAKIAAGGMGVVYRACDEVTNTAVAIKILLADLTRDAVSVARFRQEAALGARLSHPNLCHIIGTGTTPSGGEYVVMPLLPGDSLWDRTASGQPLPLDFTVRIIGDICAGLHQVHQLGVIHRDLKPENIILVPEPDGTERAVLLDFGLVSFLNPEASRPRLTRTGMVVGTPEFMSPEQISGKAVDRRSDVYALAFLAYEMLTGELPFAGNTLRELALARLKGELISLRKYRPDLPAAVEKVLAKAMSVAPDERYDTTIAFSAALSRADEPSGRGFLDRLLRRGNVTAS